MSTATLREVAEGAANQSSQAIGALLGRLTQEADMSVATLREAADGATTQSSEAIGALLSGTTWAGTRQERVGLGSWDCC